MIQFNSNAGEVALILLVALCFFTTGLFLAVRPRDGARLLARTLRVYQRTFKLSDRQLNENALPFQRSLLSGDISRFAESGVEAPEDFPTVIAYVRVFGVLIAGMLGLALCFVLGLFLLSLLLR